MVVADQLLTPATLLLFLLLLIVIGVWLQLAMLRIRLSSRLSHIEGRLDEQDHLHKLLTSPNPCREPTAALKELRRWFAAMTRAVEIGMVLPGLDQLYRGARSIYSGAFEGDDFALRLRWTTVEQQKKECPTTRTKTKSTSPNSWWQKSSRLHKSRTKTT